MIANPPVFRFRFVTGSFITHRFLIALVKNVVVTGAAGFIGAYIADVLERRGYHIVRSDILRPAGPNDGWRLADLTQIDELVELTRGAAVVCHIGGIGDVY